MIFEAKSYLHHPALSNSLHLVMVQPTTDIVSGSIVEKAFYSQDLIQIDVEKINFTQK